MGSKLKATEHCNLVKMSHIARESNIDDDFHPLQSVINMLNSLGDSHADFTDAESEDNTRTILPFDNSTNIMRLSVGVASLLFLMVVLFVIIIMFCKTFCRRVKWCECRRDDLDEEKIIETDHCTSIHVNPAFVHGDYIRSVVYSNVA